MDTELRAKILNLLDEIEDTLQDDGQSHSAKLDDLIADIREELQ